MQVKGPRRLASTLLSVQLVFTLWMQAWTPALAQAIDPDPPLIEHERLLEGTIGDSQVFSARITDNIGVESATLHYRLSDEGEYESVPMEPVAGSDVRSVSIETEGMNATVIQYYIEARDAAGNRSIRGFAFDPMERALVGGSGQTGAPVAGDDSGLSTGRKVLYGVLGLAVVGALVAAASDSGDNEPGDGRDVPVNITVQQP